MINNRTLIPSYLSEGVCCINGWSQESIPYHRTSTPKKSQNNDNELFIIIVMANTFYESIIDTSGNISMLVASMFSL